MNNLTKEYNESSTLVKVAMKCFIWLWVSIITSGVFYLAIDAGMSRNTSIGV